MKFDLVCFGELLWDILPEKKVAGGAPFNIVNRASSLGLNARIISSVGLDLKGDELVALVHAKGNSTEFIQRHPTLPTSEVLIQLGPGGEPHYQIVYPVAWDDIFLEEANLNLVKNCRAMVYSSLGIRDKRSRDVLFKMLDYAKFKICDINLREGHYEKQTIIRMLDHADVLRMNENELNEVAGWLDLSHMAMDECIEKIAKLYQYDSVIVTLGGEGAISYRNQQFHRHPVFEVNVIDTVGSGDAFLAAYITCRLDLKSEAECLKYACAVGALNASKNGGTPEITDSEIETLLMTA